MIRWDGLLSSRNLKPYYAANRRLFSLAAENNEWEKLFYIHQHCSVNINDWKLDDPSFNTPLHLAVERRAPVEVIRELVRLGAWRSLVNAAGERPCDIAARQNNHELAEELKPVFIYPTDDAEIQQIQKHIHRIILERGARFLESLPLRLPEISVMLEKPKSELWFAIYGMYGGFSLKFEYDNELLLISSSWSRIIEGSGRRHYVTARHAELGDSGFV